MNITGGTLYCTNFPCSICSKMIINAGLTEIVYLDGYPDELARTLLEEARIQQTHFPDAAPRRQESP